MNITDKLGWQPLHTVLKSSNPDLKEQQRYNIVELLIKHGANVNARNKGWSIRYSRYDSHVGKRMSPIVKAETPLGIAIEKEYSNIVELLRQHGATE